MNSNKKGNSMTTAAEQKEILIKKQEYEELGIPVDRLKVCHGLKLE